MPVRCALDRVREGQGGQGAVVGGEGRYDRLDLFDGDKRPRGVLDQHKVRSRRSDSLEPFEDRCLPAWASGNGLTQPLILESEGGIAFRVVRMNNRHNHGNGRVREERVDGARQNWAPADAAVLLGFGKIPCLRTLAFSGGNNDGGYEFWTCRHIGRGTRTVICLIGLASTLACGKSSAGSHPVRGR